MTERVRSASTTSAYYRCPKMENDLSPRKTMLVLVIVVGCFAVLWPKVFYPMLVGSANQHIKPSPIDKTTGCCDVISETDVNTIKIMSELCGTIIKSKEDKPLTGKEIVQRCREEILQTCGIDISVVLQEQVRLGQNVKQILDEVRSLNGSLCLKYNFGVAPWRLGVPHRMTIKLAPVTPHIRQERPHHLRSELVHPAFRERGRAIPQPQVAPPSRPPPRIVEGRPGPVPGMRPTIGGAGHVVPPSKQGTSSMSVIMPIYTIGIVIFFTYTLMRIIFKKQPEGVGGSLYPPIDPDPHFRKEVFESESSRLGPRYSRDNISSKLVVNAMSALLDEVDQEIEARRKSNEVASQDLVNGTLSNGDVVKPQDTEEQPTVKVLGMEMTASCEGGKKWSRPDSPVLPTSPPPPPAESVPPPQEIYLEGALPAQSHLLVADSATEPQPTTGEDPAVVLSGKMTLSVISLDSENGADDASEKPLEEAVPSNESRTEVEEQIQKIIQESVLEPEVQELTSESVEAVQKREMENDVNEKVPEIEEEYEIEEYELHPLIMKRFDAPPVSKIQIEDLEKQNQESSQSATITEQKIEQTIVQTPLIHLESDESSHSVEVEELEKEVDSLIQEAIESIEQGQPVVKAIKNIEAETTEIDNSLHKTPEQTVSLEQKLKTDNETMCKDSSIQQLEESNQAEITLHNIEEQLKIATDEVVKLTSMDVDVLDEKDQKNDAGVETLLREGEVENKLKEIPKSIDDKLNSEIKTEKTNEQEIEHSAEQQKTSELQTLKSDEPVERLQSESIELFKKDQKTDKESVPVSEEIGETQVSLQETFNNKPTEATQIHKDEQASEVSGAHISEKTEDKPKPKEELVEKTVTDAERASETDVNENKEQKSGEAAEIYTDDDELGSDEELVEEIEEIVYEEESEEEEEASEEEIARLTNRTDSASVQRVNGERSEDVEESKYTTVSTTVNGNTAAENEISDEELTDDEVEDEEEIIEVEDDEEIEEDYAADESYDVNHTSGESEPEL